MARSLTRVRARLLPAAREALELLGDILDGSALLYLHRWKMASDLRRDGGI
jgi:hypothetical protein